MYCPEVGCAYLETTDEFGFVSPFGSRRRTVDFARWIATQMLNQHLLRFQIEGTGSNTNRWEEAYNLLHDEFSRDDLQQALRATGSTTQLKQVIYRWKLLGCIEALEDGLAPSGKKQTVRFRKLPPSW